MGENYVLQAPSSEVKKAWVKDISRLLWRQAIRNRGKQSIIYLIISSIHTLQCQLSFDNQLSLVNHTFHGTSHWELWQFDQLTQNPSSHSPCAGRYTLFSR